LLTFQLGTLKERGYLENVGADEMDIIKLHYEGIRCEVWSGFIWPRQEAGCRLL